MKTGEIVTLDGERQVVYIGQKDGGIEISDAGRLEVVGPARVSESGAGGSPPGKADDPLDGVTVQLEGLLKKLQKDLDEKQATVLRRRDQIKRLERVVKMLRAETGATTARGRTGGRMACGHHPREKAHEACKAAAVTDAAAELNAR